MFLLVCNSALFNEDVIRVQMSLFLERLMHSEVKFYISDVFISVTSVSIYLMAVF